MRFCGFAPPPAFVARPGKVIDQFQPFQPQLAGFHRYKGGHCHSAGQQAGFQHIRHVGHEVERIGRADMLDHELCHEQSGRDQGKLGLAVHIAPPCNGRMPRISVSWHPTSVGSAYVGSAYSVAKYDAPPMVWLPLSSIATTSIS